MQSTSVWWKFNINWAPNLSQAIIRATKLAYKPSFVLISMYLFPEVSLDYELVTFHLCTFMSLQIWAWGLSCIPTTILSYFSCVLVWARWPGGRAIFSRPSLWGSRPSAAFFSIPLTLVARADILVDIGNAGCNGLLKLENETISNSPHVCRSTCLCLIQKSSRLSCGRLPDTHNNVPC